MIMCECGERFKTTKVGNGIVTVRGLFSCDTKVCQGCAKVILDVAESPVAVGDRVETIARSMREKGLTVYGKE